MAEKTLTAVVQEAFRPRRLPPLRRRPRAGLGMSGISKSQASPLMRGDRRQGKGLRPIEGDWPYLWIDGTYVKVRLLTGRTW